MENQVSSIEVSNEKSTFDKLMIISNKLSPFLWVGISFIWMHRGSIENATYALVAGVFFMLWRKN